MLPEVSEVELKYINRVSPHYPRENGPSDHNLSEESFSSRRLADLITEYISNSDISSEFLDAISANQGHAAGSFEAGLHLPRTGVVGNFSILILRNLKRFDTIAGEQEVMQFLQLPLDSLMQIGRIQDQNFNSLCKTLGLDSIEKYKVGHTIIDSFNKKLSEITETKYEKRIRKRFFEACDYSAYLSAAFSRFEFSPTVKEMLAQLSEINGLKNSRVTRSMAKASLDATIKNLTNYLTDELPQVRSRFRNGGHPRILSQGRLEDVCLAPSAFINYRHLSNYRIEPKRGFDIFVMLDAYRGMISREIQRVLPDVNPTIATYALVTACDIAFFKYEAKRCAKAVSYGLTALKLAGILIP